jgi:membrane protein implicated in regulation of membrane protease activity
MSASRQLTAYLLRETAELVLLIAVLAIVSRFVGISTWLWIGLPLVKVATSVGAYALFFRRTFHRPAQGGSDLLIGRRVQTLTRLDPSGHVKVGGEIWAAQCDTAEPVPAQSWVDIVAVRGTTVYVGVSPTATPVDCDAESPC